MSYDFRNVAPNYLLGISAKHIAYSVDAHLDMLQPAITGQCWSKCEFLLAGCSPDCNLQHAHGRRGAVSSVEAFRLPC